MAAIDQYGRLFRVTLRIGGHAEPLQRAWIANKDGSRSDAKSTSVLRWVNLRAITYIILLCLLSLDYIGFYFELKVASSLSSIALGFSLS